MIYSKITAGWYNSIRRSNTTVHFFEMTEEEVIDRCCTIYGYVEPKWYEFWKRKDRLWIHKSDPISVL